MKHPERTEFYEVANFEVNLGKQFCQGSESVISVGAFSIFNNMVAKGSTLNQKLVPDFNLSYSDRWSGRLAR